MVFFFTVFSKISRAKSSRMSILKNLVFYIFESVTLACITLKQKKSTSVQQYSVFHHLFFRTNAMQ